MYNSSILIFMGWLFLLPQYIMHTYAMYILNTMLRLLILACRCHGEVH